MRAWEDLEGVIYKDKATHDVSNILCKVNEVMAKLLHGDEG